MQKQLNYLDIHCRHLISLTPFLVLGTQAIDGMEDVTPRGDAPGFVKVPDDRTLLIPDRPGNNRLDDYSNVLGNPEVSLMFLIPGVKETLRINGIAGIRNDADLFGMFTVAHKTPLTVLKVTVREVHLHCAKALMRSKLWSPDAIIARTTLSSMGQMIKDQINSKGPVESQADMEARYEKTALLTNATALALSGNKVNSEIQETRIAPMPYRKMKDLAPSPHRIFSRL